MLNLVSDCRHPAPSPTKLSYREQGMPSRPSRPAAVLAVAVYPPNLAATRLRLQQYGPAFRDAGIELRLRSFFSARHLDRWGYR